MGIGEWSNYNLSLELSNKQLRIRFLVVFCNYVVRVFVVFQKAYIENIITSDTALIFHTQGIKISTILVQDASLHRQA